MGKAGRGELACVLVLLAVLEERVEAPSENHAPSSRCSSTRSFGSEHRADSREKVARCRLSRRRERTDERTMSATKRAKGVAPTAP